MSTLQFSLFFAALLVGYLLVHVRLVRFERYLEEVAGLKQMNERLERVAQSIERVRLDRTEQALSLLHEDLGAVVEACGRVERAVRRNADSVVVPTVPVGTSVESTSIARRICDSVTDRLLALGYRNLRVLSDLTNATLEDRTEITVECEKRQTSYKGKVVAQNGAVVDLQLQSVNQAFP